MNAPPANQPPHDSGVPEVWGERISAYLDGELSVAEAADVERYLADEPAARRLADDLRGVSRTVQGSPAPTFNNDLASSVVAEALRRQATGEDAAELPDRLEPEGDFGLPFGKSARGWSWAGVAVAAAVLISFYGRPERPAGPGVAVTQQPIDQAVYAIQQATPNLRVVDYQATPDKLERLRRYFAVPSAQRANLPSGLMTVAEAADPQSLGGSQEQLVYVDAEEAELDRLLADLDGAKQVGVDRSTPAPPAAPSKVRAVPLRIKLSPEAIAKLKQQAQAKGATPTAPGGRRLVVLRIRVKPANKPTQPSSK
ncbi:hypothetical protein MalM25_02100 [Planctomycetes bacterium MalM25]|nr:hypothetical protein MalM25_02100 [Planctomycetes bacterium MalM25]